jgi:serine/threonine-protein kinase
MPGTNPFGGSRTTTPVPSVVVGPEADPFIGMALGDFRIDGFIAQGGMGRVYTATNRTVGNLRQAVKVLLNPTEEADRERFLKEAHAASTARSGNIVAISNFGFLPQGQPYLMMELLEGRTLERYLEVGRRLPFLEALGLAGQVLAALKVIHDEAKLVHRDLKPANLFLVNDRSQGLVLKVMDLGMAAARPRVHPETGIGAHLEADRGGTPAYASPEQFGNYAVGTASDVYSLGVVLYEMLTGQLPFPEVPGESDTALARRHVHERPRDPQLLVPDLPEDVASLVLSMLAKEPPARPTVGAAANTVLRLRERYRDRRADGPTHVGPAPGPPSQSRAHLPTDRLPPLADRLTERSLPRKPARRRSSPWGAGAAVLALVLLFLAGAGGAWWWTERGAPAGGATPAVARPAGALTVEGEAAGMGGAASAGARPMGADGLPVPGGAASAVARPVGADPLPVAGGAAQTAGAPHVSTTGAAASGPGATPPRPAGAPAQDVAAGRAPAPRREVGRLAATEPVADACQFDEHFRDYARRTATELRELAVKAKVDPEGQAYAGLEDARSTAMVARDCGRVNQALDGLRKLVGASDE